LRTQELLGVIQRSPTGQAGNAVASAGISSSLTVTARSRQRDWLGLLAGLACLLCSGVAVTLIIVAGLSVLVRRGWRAALFHTAPLGLVCLVWWLAFARNEYTAAGGSVGGVVRFAWSGVSTTFGEIGQLPGFGVVVGLVLLGGLLVAWRGLDQDELRRRAAAPGALLVGSVVFLATAGVVRAPFPASRVRKRAAERENELR
jgi:hypothetical protein